MQLPPTGKGVPAVAILGLRNQFHRGEGVVDRVVDTLQALRVAQSPEEDQDHRSEGGELTAPNPPPSTTIKPIRTRRIAAPWYAARHKDAEELRLEPGSCDATYYVLATCWISWSATPKTWISSTIRTASLVERPSSRGTLRYVASSCLRASSESGRRRKNSTTTATMMVAAATGSITTTEIVRATKLNSAASALLSSGTKPLERLVEPVR